MVVRSLSFGEYCDGNRYCICHDQSISPRCAQLLCLHRESSAHFGQRLTVSAFVINTVVYSNDLDELTHPVAKEEYELIYIKSTRLLLLPLIAWIGRVHEAMTSYVYNSLIRIAAREVLRRDWGCYSTSKVVRLAEIASVREHFSKLHGLATRLQRSVGKASLHCLCDAFSS